MRRHWQSSTCPTFTRSPTELGNDPIERTLRQVEFSSQRESLRWSRKRNGANGPMVFLPLMLIWLRDPMYFNVPSRWAMVAFAISIGLIAPELGSDRKSGGLVAASEATRASGSNHGQASTASASGGSTSLLREGTRVANQDGQFSQADGVWFFTPTASAGSRESSSSRIRVLENLALQRVVQMIQQDPSDNRWVISGVITEYFGENRVMVSMAVRAPIDSEDDR